MLCCVSDAYTWKIIQTQDVTFFFYGIDEIEILTRLYQSLIYTIQSEKNKWMEESIDSETLSSESNKMI